jgi:C-terminal, D2-small domain, of ClpB protein
MQVFKQLRGDSVLAIVQRLLAQSAERAAGRCVAVGFTDAATALVCAEGVDVESGARKLRRAVTALVDDKLADFLLARDAEAVAGLQLTVDSIGGEMVVYETGSSSAAADDAEEDVRGEGQQDSSAGGGDGDSEAGGGGLPTPQSSGQGQLVSGGFIEVLEPRIVQRVRAQSRRQ